MRAVACLREEHIERVNHMKKSYLALTASCVIGMAGAALPASAAGSDPLRVSVPFAFRAGAANLPAGNYTVSEEDSGIVSIRGEKSGVFVLGRTGSEPDLDKSGLSFERTEKGYVLKNVHAFGKASVTLVPGAVEHPPQ